MRASSAMGDPRNGACGHGVGASSFDRDDLAGVLEAFLNKEVPEVMIRPA